MFKISRRVISQVARPRLEWHFYSNLCQDLQALSFDPEKEIPEADKSTTTLRDVFSIPLSELPTKPTGEVTSHMFSLMPPQKKVYKPHRMRMNPIDFTNTKLITIPDPEQPPIETKFEAHVPQLNRIVLKILTDAAIGNKQILLGAIMSMSQIAGVRAVPLFAERGDAQRRIRAGMPMGAMVELTGTKMYEFLDKLVHVVLPRLREWEGVNPLRDEHGAISLTLNKAAVGYFPDIEPFFDMYPRLFDMDVRMYTTGKSSYEDVCLLSGMGVPFMEKPVLPKEEETGLDPNDPYAIYKKKAAVAKGKRVLPPIQGTPVRKKAP